MADQTNDPDRMTPAARELGARPKTWTHRPLVRLVAPDCDVAKPIAGLDASQEDDRIEEDENTDEEGLRRRSDDEIFIASQINDVIMGLYRLEPSTASEVLGIPGRKEEPDQVEAAGGVTPESATDAMRNPDKVTPDKETAQGTVSNPNDSSAAEGSPGTPTSTVRRAGSHSFGRSGKIVVSEGAAPWMHYNMARGVHSPLSDREPMGPPAPRRARAVSAESAGPAQPQPEAEEEGSDENAFVDRRDRAIQTYVNSFYRR